MNKKSKPKLRRQAWWGYLARPDMTALCLERLFRGRRWLSLVFAVPLNCQCTESYFSKYAN